MAPARAVFTHLVATGPVAVGGDLAGLVAIGDNLIESVAGGSVLARL